MIVNNESKPHIHPEQDQSTFSRQDCVKETLYVITPIFNPKRFRSRWKLYKNFEKYILDSKQAHLVTIECTYGHREKCITRKESPNHTVIHVKTNSEIWLKENLINLAIQRLPENWKYVAWIDADIMFARQDWVGETIQKLQHYQFVQMFSQAVDLSPKYEIIKQHYGFMYCYVNHIPNKNRRMALPYYDSDDAVYWHPGFAWAARREAIDAVGGLVDWSILGGGDMFMAYALIGQLNPKSLPKSLGKSGLRLLKEWQARAEKYIKRNVGYVDGLLLHNWHGKKKDRKYKDRGQILTDAKFDPELDLKKDWQGLYQLTDRSLELRDNSREYFSQRNEDSIDE